MAMAENLDIAGRAVNAVRSLGYKSNNRGALLDGLSPGTDADGLGRFALQRQGDISRETLGIFFREFPKGEEPNGLQNLVAPAATGRQLRFGNCETRAALALIYVATQSEIRPLELFSVGEDHVFMVIGRTAGLPREPAGWNDESVICDPWAEQVYAKSQMMQKIRLPPVQACIGPDPKFSMCFEHREVAWPPAVLSSSLKKYALDRIWLPPSP